MGNQQHSGYSTQEKVSDMFSSQPGSSSESDFPSVTEAEIAALLQLSPDALIIVNGQGKMVLVNAQAATLFGYTPEELLGQLLERLLPERFRAGHVAHRAGYVG